MPFSHRRESPPGPAARALGCYDITDTRREHVSPHKALRGSPNRLPARRILAVPTTALPGTGPRQTPRATPPPPAAPPPPPRSTPVDAITECRITAPRIAHRHPRCPQSHSPTHRRRHTEQTEPGGRLLAFRPICAASLATAPPRHHGPPRFRTGLAFPETHNDLRNAQTGSSFGLRREFSGMWPHPLSPTPQLRNTPQNAR